MLKRCLLLVMCLCLASCSKPSEPGPTKPRSGPSTEEKPVDSLGATALFLAYASDPEKAGKKYSGQLVEVHAPIKTFSMGSDPIVVELKVDDPEERRHIRCLFDSKDKKALEELRIGNEIFVRGRCDGRQFNYITISNCVLVKEKRP